MTPEAAAAKLGYVLGRQDLSLEEKKQVKIEQDHSVRCRAPSIKEYRIYGTHRARQILPNFFRPPALVVNETPLIKTPLWFNKGICKLDPRGPNRVILQFGS